jgi:hypothetical protein
VAKSGAHTVHAHTLHALGALEDAVVSQAPVYSPLFRVY